MIFLFFATSFLSAIAAFPSAIYIYGKVQSYDRETVTLRLRKDSMKIPRSILSDGEHLQVGQKVKVRVDSKTLPKLKQSNR